MSLDAITRRVRNLSLCGGVVLDGNHPPPPPSLLPPFARFAIAQTLLLKWTTVRGKHTTHHTCRSRLGITAKGVVVAEGLDKVPEAVGGSKGGPA